MPHGQPDFGMYAQKKTTFGLSDMGELAARLGSIVTYDRRGDVVWLEDFAQGMTNWVVGGAGLYIVEESAEESLSKGVSLKTVVPNTGPFNAYFWRRDALPVSSRLGIEYAFLPDDDVDDIFLDFEIYDGDDRHQARIEFRVDDGVIRYFKGGVLWTELVTDIEFRADGRAWHHFKLVVDYVTDEFVRLLLDNIEYSMAGLPLFVTAPFPADPYLHTLVEQVYAGGVATPTLFFDNIILTQNEP